MTGFEVQKRRALPLEVLRELDRVAAEDFGIPGLLLMENAGSGAFERLRQLMSESQRRKIVVLAGRGNNAGDGFVVARQASNAGFAVSVILVDEESALPPDAALNLEIAKRMGLDIRKGESLRLHEIIEKQESETLLVDALLGSGLKGAPREPIASWIQEANRAPCPIVALDIPSGLNADSGEALGELIEADLTLTFAAAKPGLFLGQGKRSAGKVEIVPISIPRSLLEQAYAARGIVI